MHRLLDRVRRRLTIRRAQAGIAVLAGLALVGAAGPSADETVLPRAAQIAAPTAADARVQAGVAKLYDTSKLHRIDIVIPDADVYRIQYRTTDRLRCTFTFDGVTLKDVGVRQAGGVYHAYQPITNKPSLSLKFDEFTKGQTLFGLDKLVLKNELQDSTLVNEHLAYEVFRRAGLAASLTAHAVVTINGIDNGIYLMREPVDKEFLVRNFGKGMEDGNLYEIENVREFVFDPTYPALDDEGKDGRNRADLMAFAAAIRETAPDSFVADLSKYLDIDRFVTYVAAEAVTRHWDGFAFKNNNTYMYALPKDGRFVFIPYGMDQALLSSRGFQAFGRPWSYLAQQMMGVPSLAAKYRLEVARIGAEPVWNQRVLLDRVDAVGRVLDTASRSGRTGYDVSRFESYRSSVENLIRNGGTY